MDESKLVISEVSSCYSKEAKRWKAFMVAYKKHRFISPFGIISTNEGGQNFPFRYIIHSLKNLSMPEAKDAAVNSIVYAFVSATFLSKRKAKFFGRTYQSEPIQLTESKSAQRTFETSQPHVFYCHTQVDDNADSMLVMELELKGAIHLLRNQFER